MKDFISFVSLLMAYLGLAGFFGAVIRSTTEQGRIYRAIFFGTVLIPFSIILPWTMLIKIPAWIIATLVIILIYYQFTGLIRREWFKKIALVYFGVLMIFVLGWAIFSNITYAWLWMGIPAALASLTCWVKLNHVKVI